MLIRLSRYLNLILKINRKLKVIKNAMYKSQGMNIYVGQNSYLIPPKLEVIPPTWQLSPWENKWLWLSEMRQLYIYIWVVIHYRRQVSHHVNNKHMDRSWVIDSSYSLLKQVCNHVNSKYMDRSWVIGCIIHYKRQVSHHVSNRHMKKSWVINRWIINKCQISWVIKT